MKESGITLLNRPARLLPVKDQQGARTRFGDAQGSTGYVVTAAAYREFVRSARLRPYVASELRRWRAGRDLIAVGAAIRTAFAEAPLPDQVAQAIEAGYGSIGGEGTVVAVRCIGPSGVAYHERFEGVSTTHELLTACRRCFAAPYANWAIQDREDRGVSQLDVAVSIGIERASAPAKEVVGFAPTPGDCAGYVVGNAEMLRLAAWAVAVERNHSGRQRPR